ncbi:MAG: hypothetical protein WKG00_36105 [Polyangiaceae bacterium]
MVSPAPATSYSWRGIGVARAEYQLWPDRLEVTLPGVQLGKSLHEATIPVADIEGFYVKGPVRYVGGPRAAALNAGTAAMGMAGQLLLAWRPGGKRKRRGFTMLDVRSQEFASLVLQLAALRPDADLRRLPEAEAKKRLGMWSDKAISLAFIAGVLVFVCVLMLVVQLVK